MPPRSPVRPRARATPLLLALALATGGALAAGAGACRRAPAELAERRVTAKALDLLYEGRGWSVVEPPPHGRVRVTSMTPSFDEQVDGGERSTLSMPPPCTVTLEVPADLEGPLELTGFAGIGRRFRSETRLDVVFEVEVEVGGRPVWTTTVPTFAPSGAEVAWRALDADLAPEADRVPGPGLAVAPGERVTLRTRLAAPEGAPALDAPAYRQRVRAGFADLRIVRNERRTARRASRTTPSVVLIVMDTLRADRVACYGGAPATPALDALAARGVRFDNAYATSSWTWPSTASLLTGLAADEHGVLDPKACILSPELETVGEVLARRGFLTGAFVCNPLISARWRFDQGFESFEGSTGFRFGPDVVPDALAWLDRAAGTRFFLYLHMVDTHGPYDLTPAARDALGPPPDGYPHPGGIRYSEKKLSANREHKPNGEPDPDAVLPPAHQAFLRAEYDAAVVSADHHVGVVLERLRTLGIEDSTVVVFTSDHGEGLLDHGYATHGYQLYEELVRVPLIVAGPGVPQGRVVETLVSNRHVAPTIARLGGAELARVEDAEDLLQLAAEGPRTVAFTTHNGLWNGRGRLAIRGVRQGPWTLHYAEEGRPWTADPDAPPPALGPRTGEVRLYRLDQDPEQRVDLSAEEPQRVEELLHAVDRARERAEERRPVLRAAAGRGTLELLRGIGYVEGAEDEDG